MKIENLNRACAINKLMDDIKSQKRDLEHFSNDKFQYDLKVYLMDDDNQEKLIVSESLLYHIRELIIDEMESNIKTLEKEIKNL